ncbi:MAG TPA: AEC family transporter [Steroidobacteraceae bacterium]|nr:AEC family transporter [Steroidobacteraceae bacterium]
MSALLLLVVCLVLGVLVARIARPPAGLAQSLNWWVINVAFSGLVLHLIPTLRFDWHLWFLPASMWLVFLGAWALFAMLGRALHWSRARVGGLTLVCGLGNTSFIGFPMIEALHGQEGLKLALVADQLGCFIALGVGGTLVAALYSGKRASAAEVTRRVLTFPPMVSLVVGVIAAQLGAWPQPVAAIFERLGATLVPVALFSVGLQFRLRFQKGQTAALGLALGWKLALAPLLIWLCGLAIGVSKAILTIAVLQAAMAPMITATILAEQNDLEPQLASTVLGLGIVLSLLTVPLADRLLGS